MASLLEKLQAKIKEQEAPKFQNDGRDDRFWNVTQDDSGAGTAIIRFLPPKTDDDLPWVRVYNHGYQENGKWFIENCPTSIGEECPVCTANRALWATKIKSNEDLARTRARRERFIANVLVIKDPANPENDGKVFLFQFGKKIFEKLTKAMTGDEVTNESPVNPFAIFPEKMTWNGQTVEVNPGNLVLRVARKAGFPNYDASQVKETEVLFGGDGDKIDKLLDSMYDLKEFVDKKNFKSFEKLKERFENVSNVEVSFETKKETPAKEKYDEDDVPFDVEPKNVTSKKKDDLEDDMEWLNNIK